MWIYAPDHNHFHTYSYSDSLAVRVQEYPIAGPIAGRKIAFGEYGSFLHIP